MHEQETKAPATEIPDFLQTSKIIRIAVTGDVLITRLEKEIIDSPDFQRLRGVRQLGSVNLVYPTALHTRFDHCLGTLAMASRMIEAIRNNTHNEGPEKEITYLQEAIARLYALLHDLPHIPFGHTIEDELGIFKRHDKNDARIERFLGPKSEVGKLITEYLDKEGYERFLSIYQWNGKFGKVKGENEEEKGKRERIEKSIIDNDDAFIYDLVSNTVCADLLDYLLRDSYFCNIVLGLDYRFLNFLYLMKESGDHNVRRVFVRLWKKEHREPRRDTLTDLVRLLEARYIVAERAYFHHAKIISGVMLGRAIQEANSAGEAGLGEEDLYGYSDDILLYKLRGSKNPIVARLANDFATRRLYKAFHKYIRTDFDAVQGHDHAENPVMNALSLAGDPKKRKNLEDRLASEIDADLGDVLIYAPEEGMNLKAAEMKVLWKAKAIPLKEIDDKVVAPKLTAILEAHRMLWAIQIIVRPGLSDEQLDYLKRACDIEFLSPPSKKIGARGHLYEGLVERRLSQMGIKMPEEHAEYCRLKSEAAKQLASLDFISQDLWSEQTNEIVRSVFSAKAEAEKAQSTTAISQSQLSLEIQSNGANLEKQFLDVFQSYFGSQYPTGVTPALKGWYRENLSDSDRDEKKEIIDLLSQQVAATPAATLGLQKRPGSKILEFLDGFLKEYKTRPKARSDE